MDWLVETPGWRDRNAFEYASLKDKMETYPTFPTGLVNAPATRLFSDVSFSDVFFSISFETCLPPLASENKLPKVETFLQRKFFPSQKCQTQSLNVIMVIWPPRVGEAISRKILKLRPWVKNLRSKQGNFERQRHPPFASEQSRPTAAPEVHI